MATRSVFIFPKLASDETNAYILPMRAGLWRVSTGPDLDGMCHRAVNGPRASPSAGADEWTLSLRCCRSRPSRRSTAMGRFRPIVIVHDFSGLATCYADSNGRVRPRAVVPETGD
jgi:hypothetical protein